MVKTKVKINTKHNKNIIFIFTSYHVLKFNMYLTSFFMCNYLPIELQYHQQVGIAFFRQ